ncbi:phage major capsid protein [Streptococcus pluranimalium]|uniref:Phage major capsid protein n=1 Tax=Helcococcus bovis TaxID=3153252 RepID=A0ABW9F848_9FIRM|nr:phage major capsid protein [Streptococcus agalactiae]HEM2695163.1 phage major capsid protein [Streptococcus suis]KAF1268415.1 capsid protein [Streptococcus agalactiae]MCD0152348.1 phage major capsid protein [Streptococcus agalactiae]RRA51987.1 phage major capsid protein [Streptococcus agalactiae]HEM2709486.1 phage major capsid protein [Streptococcus suis]
MSKILEMIEKRNKAWEGAKAFVEANKDKDGLLSKEHMDQYQQMEDKIKNFSQEIDRMQREEQMEKELSKPINKPITEKPHQDKHEKTGRASKEYKDGMLKALRTNFKQVSNVLQEGVDADGGYLVPEEYDERLITVLEEENIIRSLATIIQTSGNHKINIAGTSPAAAWIDEGEELKFSDATFKQMLLDAHKLHVAIKVTEELLYDSAFDLEDYITEQFGKALANAEEDAFLNGDGNNKPTGIFNETSGGTFLDKVSAIKADDVINLVHALKRPYRKNAVFITNDKTIAQIRKFKDSNGAYIWQPSYQQGEPDRLLGYPVYTSAFAPENAIAFGDISYYNIGDRGSRSFKALTELFAGNGMIGYVAKERVDAKLIVKEAVQILSVQG